MDPVEQQLFALELIVSLRIALDGPEVRQRLVEAITQFPADAHPTEQAIRRRAADLVLSSGGPTPVRRRT